MFVEGAASLGWRGVGQFIKQLQDGGSMAGGLGAAVGGVALNSSQLDYGSKVLSEITTAFLSMQDQYSRASIAMPDGSDSIAFSALVPNLFTPNNGLAQNMSNHL